MFEKKELVKTEEYWQEILENNLYAFINNKITGVEFIKDTKSTILKALKLVSHDKCI